MPEDQGASLTQSRSVDGRTRRSDAPGRVIGIGASAGGVDALTRVVVHLAPELTTAVCIVLHVPAGSRSLLAPILDRRSRAVVRLAEDGEPLRADRVLDADEIGAAIARLGGRTSGRQLEGVR